IAISLGLMEETAAAPALLAEFENAGDRLVKGYLGLALGLLRSDASTVTLKRELKDDNDPAFRVQLATALGLMGDPEVSDLLVSDFRDSKTLYATSSIAKALGHVGDRGAVKPLTVFVGEKKRVALARGFACVALGLLCEKTKLPWNERLAAGSNYLTGLGSQAEMLDIL
ncbi:MAG: HEAT repeat domain-containing protein, partial [Planctomycetes bacterium]|nr:HEAT repeat domain-containing protein [Planctomycetota bacterium]